ncbi:MAG: hypothetical protein IJB00_05145 [Akkermansia sp.]|nr:hypothetical protein [Akkermansia sp.]
MKHIIKLLLLLCCLSAFLPAYAQVELRLQPIRRDFIVGENVALKLTIVNHTDATISLTNIPGRPWLYFMVGHRGQDGPIAPVATPRFPNLKLTPGSSRAFQVELGSFYRLETDGSYWSVATIRMPDGQSTYSSNRALFVMTNGGEVRAFNIQARGQRLRTSLRLARIDNQDSLFGQVRDADTKRIVGACYLGRYLNFMQPRVLLDAAQNMHVLCQSSAEFYTYSIMDTNGKCAQRKVYRRTGGPVDLISTGKGVRAVGLIPYVKPKAGEEGMRRVSERPQ